MTISTPMIFIFLLFVCCQIVQHLTCLHKHTHKLFHSRQVGSAYLLAGDGPGRVGVRLVPARVHAGAPLDAPHHAPVALRVHALRVVAYPVTGNKGSLVDKFIRRRG